MSNKVRLGKTELFVNPIGLGANAVGGYNIYPGIKDEVGEEVVRTAVENGVNFIDTAFSYGFGRSEEIIGKVCKELGKRADVIIATKGTQRKEGDQIIIDNSPSFLKQTVEDSLRRLQTDYIDLFYIHTPDEHTPKDEAVGALKELKDEGKIRAIGVSNFSLEQLKEANKDGYVDVYQGNYNLLDRQAEEELFPYLKEHNISFVPYFPFASGLLTGKYTKDSEISERLKRRPHFQGENYLLNLEKIDQLKEIATGKGCKVSHVVLAWYLTRDVIDAIIPGAKTREQVLENMLAAQIELTQEEIDHIDQVFQ